MRRIRITRNHRLTPKDEGDHVFENFLRDTPLAGPR